MVWIRDRHAASGPRLPVIRNSRFGFHAEPHPARAFRLNLCWCFLDGPFQAGETQARINLIKRSATIGIFVVIVIDRLVAFVFVLDCRSVQLAAVERVHPEVALAAILSSSLAVRFERFGLERTAFTTKTNSIDGNSVHHLFGRGDAFGAVVKLRIASILSLPAVTASGFEIED